jgi:hypothetical protein
MGRISLTVVPGSSRDEVVGWLGEIDRRIAALPLYR